MEREMEGWVGRVKEAEGRMRARLRELVEVESPSESKAGVDRAGELVEGWAKESGGKAKRWKQKEFGDVLELRWGRAGRAQGGDGGVLLLGHLDTVWPVGTLAEMPWREAEGKLWGPGVLDMKAGVVMALEAVRAAAEGNGGKLGRRVTLLLNPDEEVGSPVSREITERLAREHAAVYVLEPAQGLAYKTARKGIGHYRMEVEGVAAHAGVDFGSGHSAIREMARRVEEVSGWVDEGRGRTVNVGVIAGGTRSNVVAARCWAEVDVRVKTAAEAARVERMFRRLKVEDRGCRLTVTGGMNRPPMERRAGTVALFRRAQQLAAAMGWGLEEAATGGGSDGNFTAALGVPTLDGMGAVGAGAHAMHEHVVAGKLVERTVLLAGMLG